MAKMIFPKSREEWLGLRHGYVSSTESAALFGLSPYLTAFELAVIKKEAEPPEDFEGNERMSWGLRLQRAIAEGIAEDYGVKVRAISGYAVDPEIKLGASFDFEIVGTKEPDREHDSTWTCDQSLRQMYETYGAGVLEIKNVDGYIFKEQWNEVDGQIEAPAHIEIQVQHQLLSIGRAWGAVGILVGGNRQILLKRMRDRETDDAIRSKVERFWRGLAEGHMPPVSLPADADIIRRLYKYAEPGKLLDLQGENNNAEIHQLVAQHAEATRVKSEAEKNAKSTGAALLMAIQDAEKVLLDGFTVNAGTIAAAEIKAYIRAPYRSLRVYPRKGGK